MRTKPSGAAAPRRVLRGLCAAVSLLIAGECLPVGAGVIRVTFRVPTPERIDMTGIQRVLVTRFIVDEEMVEFDLNREMVTLLRRELHKGTNLEILDVEAPPLPEQPLPDLLANTGFWRRLAESHGADLVIAGKIGFEVEDRSGFVQRDVISPLTGQRIRRTRFVDREAFILELNLFFVRGSTGRLLYEDHFTGEEVFTGLSNDKLSSLFMLFEQFEEDILSILMPGSKTVQRSLFTN